MGRLGEQICCDNTFFQDVAIGADAVVVISFNKQCMFKNTPPFAEWTWRLFMFLVHLSLMFPPGERQQL